MDDDVRRHPDGSLDLDFYSRRAARLRTQAFRDFVAAKAALIRTALAVTAVAAALVVMPAADGRGWNGPKPTCNAAILGDVVVGGKS
jgi:hypothetical protein